MTAQRPIAREPRCPLQARRLLPASCAREPRRAQRTGNRLRVAVRRSMTRIAPVGGMIDRARVGGRETVDGRTDGAICGGRAEEGGMWEALGGEEGKLGQGLRESHRQPERVEAHRNSRSRAVPAANRSKRRSSQVARRASSESPRSIRRPGRSESRVRPGRPGGRRKDHGQHLRRKVRSKDLLASPGGRRRDHGQHLPGAARQSPASAARPSAAHKAAQVPGPRGPASLRIVDQ